MLLHEVAQSNYFLGNDSIRVSGCKHQLARVLSEERRLAAIVDCKGIFMIKNIVNEMRLHSCRLARFGEYFGGGYYSVL